MATYVNDLRLKEIGTGESSGTWGTETNTNLELIAEAFSYGTEASFGSDADATTTIADGATDPARSLYLKITSGVSLTATRTLTIAPNTVSKVWIIENATSGSQSINISQGSGANVTVPNGDVKVIYTDGAGAGAAVVDAFTDLNLGGTTAFSTMTGTTVNATTVDTTNIEVTNLKAKDGTASASIADSTGILTVSTSQVITGDLTVDTDTLYVDSADDRVAISGTDPQTDLHVFGSGVTTLQGASFPALKYAGSDGTVDAEMYYGAGGGNDLNIKNINSGPVIFYTNNTDVGRFDASGNLLVGTSTAVETLTVDGNVDANDYVGNTSLSNRNVIINGDMTTNQRFGTSTASVSSTKYVLDRHLHVTSGSHVFDVVQSTDVPDGRFRYSMKIDCTTANASPGAGDYSIIYHKIEGNNVVRFAGGGSGATKVGLSMWVKSNKTGNFQCNVVRNNASRVIGTTFTINSANTWEHKSFTFDGDTGGAGDTKDDNVGWTVEIWLLAGTSYSSGAVPTSWEAIADNDRAAGNTINFMDNTANELLITGFQLEAGEPTPFEHLPISETQARCYRYFYSSFSTGQETAQNNQGGSDWYLMGFRHKFADVIGLRSEYMQWQPGGRMRATPTRNIFTTTATGNTGTFELFSATGATQNRGLASSANETHGFWWAYTGTTVGQTGDSVHIIGHYSADAEL